jgi:hypothetical protein
MQTDRRNQYNYSLIRYQYLARHLAQYGSNWRIRCLAIKKLDQSPKSLLVLQTCANDIYCDVRFLIVETLIAGWKDHFITLAVLTDLAERDRHIDVQSLCVKELAYWDHHPAALGCLNKISQTASFIIRFIAIEALENRKNQLS